MTVLVLAREFDPTADAVVTELARRNVRVFRTDLAAFPTELWLDARLSAGRWTGRLWNSHHAVTLEEIRSIWNRGPRCADAIFKPYQWKIAADCGLTVADTMITDDIDAARRFVGDVPHESITIGQEMFGVAIYAESEDARVDWRSDPAGVTSGCRCPMRWPMGCRAI